MKRLLMITAFMFAANAFAQNPICVTVSDTPCDVNWSTNSAANQQGNLLEDLYLYYDTGTASNQVRWQIFLDTTLLYEDSACGCGERSYEDFITDNAHELKVVIKATGCQTPTCTNTIATVVKAYTPKTSACHQECE